jgi:hypothetical protein
VVTDDTNDTTFGKLFKREYIGDFAKSASSSVTCHLTSPARLLVKNWGLCDLLTTLILVQLQEKGGRHGV